MIQIRKLSVAIYGGSDLPEYPWEIVDPSASQALAEKTLNDIIDAYRTDERSPYHTVAFKTRASYTGLLNRLSIECGNLKLTELTEPTIDALYDKWSDGGVKKAMGHQLITMLRMLVGFGAAKLNDSECVRIHVVLRTMRFEPPPARNMVMTQRDTERFLEMAVREGEYSVALAHAFQFDCKLVQSDVIGVWIPESEPDDSDIHHEGYKWVRGLVWESESDDHILDLDGRQKQDLRKTPNLWSLFKDFRGERVGPIIKDPATGLPYRDWTFRRRWKEIADKAGLPNGIRITSAKQTA